MLQIPPIEHQLARNADSAECQHLLSAKLLEVQTLPTSLPRVYRLLQQCYLKSKPWSCFRGSWSVCSSGQICSAPASSCCVLPPAKDNKQCMLNTALKYEHHITGEQAFCGCTDADLGFDEILVFFHLLDCLVTIAAKVATRGWAVLFPDLQTDPAEVMLALAGIKDKQGLIC